MLQKPKELERNKKNAMYPPEDIPGAHGGGLVDGTLNERNVACCVIPASTALLNIEPKLSVLDSRAKNVRNGVLYIQPQVLERKQESVSFA
jgi:hypothetical protein